MTFFSILPGLNFVFDMCMISTRIKTHLLIIAYNYVYIIIRIRSAFSLVASCVLLKYTRTDDVS